MSRSKSKREGLTQQRLKEVLAYDETTGIFTWKVSRRRAKAGSVAGCIHSVLGYRIIQIDGVRFRAGRLAWLYVHGRWPTELIDHRDHNGCNDSISNLREATFAENSQNSSKKRSIGRSNLVPRGVYFEKSRARWLANIKKDGKSINLGRFLDKLEAGLVAAEAREKYHGDFAFHDGWTPEHIRALMAQRNQSALKVNNG